jgi:hypothetical protein
MPQIIKEGTTNNQSKFFKFYGMDLRDASAQESYGECPWCQKEKFYINTTTGQYQCKVCGSKGNPIEFIRKLWVESYKQKEELKGLEELRVDRKLLYSETLTYWGICKSIIDGTWLIPGYNHLGKLCNLYKYALDYKTNKRVVLSGPDPLKHQLFGLPMFNPTRKIVAICEGVWDAMAFWEAMRSARIEEGSLASEHLKLEHTGVEGSSLLNEITVIGVPGCNVFYESWVQLLADKTACFMYDSDHPRTVNNVVIEPPGIAGVKRAIGVILKAESKPQDVKFLFWGKDGFDPSKPNGFDIRDALVQYGLDVRDRLKALSILLPNVISIPDDWIEGGAKKKNGKAEIEQLQCERWETLTQAWRKAMKWTEGLDRALSVMLAVVSSTKIIGDQLWVKIISPASGGKSTLCEALSVNKKYILAKSTMRGFHSGFKTDSEGKTDHSLISKLNGKTLVTKDGDTLLQAPNKEQILSEARDLYDGTSRTHYRNATARDYEGVRMTWILCGTSSLRQIDSSELGERFLDCVIMEKIDEDLEHEILIRVAHKTEASMSFESDGELSSHYDADLVKAMRLTGGYVEYLRDHAQALLSAATIPPENLTKCIMLGKFVSYMRARPSKKQDESVERELAARLVSQLIRLTKCVTIVLNKKTADSEVLRRITKVALDTARGSTLDIIKHLHKAGTEGTSLAAVAILTNQSEDRERTLLRFLSKIGVVEVYHPKSRIAGISTRPKWRLTSKLTSLYEEVMRDAT